MEPVHPKDVTVLWHGWLKKLGGFSKRWRRRYFVFLATANGMKELRHYDMHKDVATLLLSTPKGVIAMTDVTGICTFTPSLTSTSTPASSASPPLGSTRKNLIFSRQEGHDGASAQDQRFAILTTVHVHMLAFQGGQDWGSTDSQRGLALLASLSAFYPAVDVLHTGYMSKKRERTVHASAKGIMSYWKRHFFAFLSTGDLLYFRDDSLQEFQGRVDVRHAPTVRVTGERLLEEKKKELGVLKFAKLPATYERESCLVWIATPPSKMFVVKLQEDREGLSSDGRHQELTPAAKKWLSLLLQGHAETKYTQLEQCISIGKYDHTPEIVSAVRAGIPDELRGQLWKGFSRSVDLQRRAELKQVVRNTAKTTTIRGMVSKDAATAGDTSAGSPSGFYMELSEPLDPNTAHTPEYEMIVSRLCAIAVREVRAGIVEDDPNLEGKDDPTLDSSSTRESFLYLHLGDDGDSGGNSDTEASPTSAAANTSRPQSIKQLGRGKYGHYVYPSDAPAHEWEISARRRLLIAASRFNPFSHPCPWKVACLLLAYLDEESTFWVINSILDIYLPGYFHGYRPALQIDVSGFDSILKDRVPALHAHLKQLNYPIEKTVERWFLSLFTSTLIPLPTVLRIWDAFFVQGVRIFFGVGIALFLRAEEQLFQAKSSKEALEVLHMIERTSIDADALFSHAFKDDLNISWLSEEHLNRVRSVHRHQVTDYVSRNVEHFNDKLGISNQFQAQISRCTTIVQQLLTKTGAADRLGLPMAQGLDTYAASDERDSMETVLKLLYGCLKSGADAVSKFANDLNTRRARWLALASQLAACPLTRGLNSDIQSWLSQVKEGKISGAGLDTLTRADGFKIPSISAMINDSNLFFDATTGMEDRQQDWTCLVKSRRDFALSDRFVIEGFLYSVVSMLKATGLARLECLAAAHKYAWHSGRWLQSLVDYSPEDRSDRPLRSLRRSSSNFNASPPASSLPRRKPRTLDDSDIGQRPRGDDATGSERHMGRRPSESFTHTLGTVEENKQPSGTTRGYEPFDLSYQLSHSPYHSSFSHTISQSTANDVNSKDEAQLANQYRSGEKSLREAADAMTSCFSRLVRLECRISGSDLHERLVVLEADLLEDVRAVEEQIRSGQELY